ncbi:Orotidine 5'-phosphate decarboxylase [Smittium culicis]|uniref:Orotidine 5'-phosphate decarboxylase n=1 Tax=Smittium culicis TaxID=133412 RepID=A0A1R1XTB2_9FUNG|nr:Orotidine 5'-phosphate decarboxylase [Smittium culicis]OMJ17789.1 Orotidine 5'-phosphate decarboxylase [Smittium culicis]
MEDKQTNLCLSCDLHKAVEILELADTIGPHICVLKLHIDTLIDFSESFVSSLVALSKKHNFLIFEDRKFADIGNTVVNQYKNGIYKIASWAHITNAHTLPGEGIITGLASVGKQLGRGLLLLAEMSSANNLFSKEYTRRTVDMALRNSDFVFGFIAQQSLPKLIESTSIASTTTDSKVDCDMLVLTPGVDLDKGGDSLGQVYRTPKLVIEDMGCDIIIVGRGIYNAKSESKPAEIALKFKAAGWNSYLNRIAS